MKNITQALLVSLLCTTASHKIIGAESQGPLTLNEVISKKDDALTVAILSNNKTDFNTRDNRNHTPLDTAVWTGRHDSAHLLLSRQAESNCPLVLYGAMNGDHKMLKLLFKYKATHEGALIAGSTSDPKKPLPNPLNILYLSYTEHKTSNKDNYKAAAQILMHHGYKTSPEFQDTLQQLLSADS